MMLAKQYQDEQNALAFEQLRALLDQVPAGISEQHEMKLIVGSEAQAELLRQELTDMGYADFGVEVAASLPVASREWTPAMPAGKEAAWHAQQPKHSAQFTKSQPSAKARKAARKRAKAGRRASR